MRGGEGDPEHDALQQEQPRWWERTGELPRRGCAGAVRDEVMDALCKAFASSEWFLV